MKNKKLLTIPAVVLVVAIICGIVFAGLSKKNTTVDNQSNEQEAVVEEQFMDLATTNDKKDFDVIQQENPDIYAWITIPGTTVDYPVLQSEEDNYYLDHKVDGSEGLPGSIYTNKVDGKLFSYPNTIVYGHNMKDGSYFGQLHLYEEASFFAQNREIYVYLPTQKLTYEIMAVSKFSDDYLSDKYMMNNTVGVQQFLADLMAFAPEDKTSHFAQEVNLGDWQQIITLSTCVKGVDEERYLVVGRLTTVEAYE